MSGKWQSWTNRSPVRPPTGYRWTRRTPAGHRARGRARRAVPWSSARPSTSAGSSSPGWSSRCTGSSPSAGSSCSRSRPSRCAAGRRDVLDEPMVSIVVAVLNEAPALFATAMRSLAAQRWARFEVIVIDDGSADPAAVRGGVPRIRLPVRVPAQRRQAARAAPRLRPDAPGLRVRAHQRQRHRVGPGRDRRHGRHDAGRPAPSARSPATSTPSTRATPG